MGDFVKSFLETELTFFPQTMQRYMGKFYSNTLYNGITWMVFILLCIRLLFELAVNALLKKMGFKEYIRTRLKKSLWYLGFYTCSYLYCSATLWKNGITLPDQEKFLQLILTEPISGHLILGYVLLCAFFISSSMWEGLLCSTSCFNYLFLTGFVAFTYFLSYIELAVLLAKTICAFHIVTEIARCFSCIIKAHLTIPNQLICFSFILSNALFINSYIAVVPGGFIMPLWNGLVYNYYSPIMICLNLTLWGWFLCELYTSPVYRLILHKWSHKCHTVNIVPECLGSTIECALFQPRDDVAYNLNVIRKDIKAEETRLEILKRPKRSAKKLLQTLKCVAAINRHVRNKRLLKEKEHHKNQDENQRSDMNFNEDREAGVSDVNKTLLKEKVSQNDLRENQRCDVNINENETGAEHAPIETSNVIQMDNPSSSGSSRDVETFPKIKSCSNNTSKQM